MGLRRCRRPHRHCIGFLAQRETALPAAESHCNDQGAFLIATLYLMSGRHFDGVPVKVATALSCPEPLAPARFEKDGSSVLDRPPLPQKARGNNRWGYAWKGGMTARAVGKVTALARLPTRQGEAHCLVSVPELFAKSATWRPVLSPHLQQSASHALWCRRQEL